MKHYCNSNSALIYALIIYYEYKLHVICNTWVTPKAVPVPWTSWKSGITQLMHIILAIIATPTFSVCNIENVGVLQSPDTIRLKIELKAN